MSLWCPPPLTSKSMLLQFPVGGLSGREGLGLRSAAGPGDCALSLQQKEQGCRLIWARSQHPPCALATSGSCVGGDDGKSAMEISVLDKQADGDSFVREFSGDENFQLRENGSPSSSKPSTSKGAGNNHDKGSRLNSNKAGRIYNEKPRAEPQRRRSWMAASGVASRRGCEEDRVLVNDDASRRSYARFSFFKENGAMTMKPDEPVFKILDTGDVALEREGTLLLEFAPALEPRRYDWSQKQVVALSVLELRGLVGLSMVEALGFLHDPVKDESDAGRTSNVRLKVEPMTDQTGVFFNFCISNISGEASGANICISLTTTDYSSFCSSINDMIPYLMGQHMVVGGLKSDDLLSDGQSTSTDHPPQPTFMAVETTTAAENKVSYAEKTTEPTASAREWKSHSSQAGRAGGNTAIPTASTTSEALAHLKHHQQQGTTIDSHTLGELLKRCLKNEDLTAARQIHHCIIQLRKDQDPYLANTLLTVYIKCRRLQDARRVFDTLKQKNNSTWSLMIAGYAKSNQTEEALKVFNLMLQEGAHPDELTCVRLLNACVTPSALKWGKEVHAHITHTGLDSDVRVGTALIQMYANCGCITEAKLLFDSLSNRDIMTWNVMIRAYSTSGRIDDAQLVFNRMEKRDVVTWNIMIKAYAESGQGREAYRLFNQMKRSGYKPNAITVMNILNVSASAGALEWVRGVHTHAPKSGLQSDLRVANALIHMYAKSGSMEDAQTVFDSLERSDVTTWTIMIGAYAESGRAVAAYRLFLQMEEEGFKPDAISYLSILNASPSARALEVVKEIHNHARKSGFESDLRVGNALVHTYAKNGSMGEARQVFDRMGERDVVTWTTLIGGLAQNGYGVEAYQLFLRMKRDGVEPNAITYLSILNASASMGALEWVKEVHSHAIQAGLELDLRVSNALIHMYAKSGSIGDSRSVFDSMRTRDVATWNAMMGGLAQHGYGLEALTLFREMIADGVQPNETSFVAVLSGCCHAGLLEDGRKLFQALREEYGVKPTVEHCNCMVDLLGRAGLLEEAELFVRSMPVEPDGVTWLALLGACRTYGNVELGELAFTAVLKLDPRSASAYVLLSNIYAAAGKWEKVSSVRAMMKERGVRKEPGRSWIEVDGEMHVFVVGDTSHPDAAVIYAELSRLTEELKAEGYIPDTQLVLQEVVEEGDKEMAVCSHSERLAIVYGLISTPGGKPIRIFKNLRVCSDCHTATKLISRVTGREIISRDVSRFHHFKDGLCSCGDYW